MAIGGLIGKVSALNGVSQTEYTCTVNLHFCSCCIYVFKKQIHLLLSNLLREPFILNGHWVYSEQVWSQIGEVFGAWCRRQGH